MIFGGAIQMDPGETVLFFLMAIGLPLVAIAGLVALLVGLGRRSRSGSPAPFPPADPTPVAPWSPEQRRTAAIVVGLCCFGSLVLLVLR